MAKAIFSVLLKFIKSVVNVILLPVNLLVVNLVPDVSEKISTFNSAISSIFGSTMGYFANFIPPYTKTLILFYLGFLVTYYTIVISVHAVLKVIEIIKAVKVW